MAIHNHLQATDGKSLAPQRHAPASQHVTVAYITSVLLPFQFSEVRQNAVKTNPSTQKKLYTGCTDKWHSDDGWLAIRTQWKCNTMMTHQHYEAGVHNKCTQIKHGWLVIGQIRHWLYQRYKVRYAQIWREFHLDASNHTLTTNKLQICQQVTHDDHTRA